MKEIIFSLVIGLCLIFTASKISAEENQFDKYGGWKGLKGDKTGVFHTQKVNDRWWIITPEGNVFWSMGVYCVRISGIPETGTEKRAYKDNCLKKYGSEEEWARITRKRIYDWGFNTFGDWSSESIYHEPGFAYLIGIDLSNKAENVIPKGSYGYFPDVFSVEFKSSVKESMEVRFKNQPYLIDDPWLLGYFLADEPSWYGSKQRRGSLVNDFISLDSQKAGKKAWVDFIKTRYPNVKDLNKAWGTNFKNLDELLSMNKIQDNPAIVKDKLAFFKVIALEFSKVLHDALREIDKYHMILGTRPSRLYPEVVEAMGEYSDIFSTSGYNLNQGYAIDPKLPEIISEVYSYSKKPILLGVIIPAQDAGFPYGIVKTQRDRGVSYWRYLAKVAAHPAVVGIHWFQHFDPPLKCYDENAANWGLVNEKDDPYEKAVNLIAQANKMVYAYALGLTDFAPEFDTALDFKKEKAPEVAKGPLKTIAIAIPNSGFEQNKVGWAFQAWQGKSKASIDYLQKHSGLASLKIQGGPDEDWGSVGVGIQYKPSFQLKPEYQYRLSAWIKTKDVENGAFVRIKVKYNNAKDAYFDTEGIYGSDEWTLVEAKFTPRDENTVEYLDAQLVGRGTAWFDDIALEVAE